MTKIIITLKDPDGVYNALDDLCQEKLCQHEKALKEDMSKEEKQVFIDMYKEIYTNKLEKWIECSEYVTIEFDISKDTAKVLKVIDANEN